MDEEQKKIAHLEALKQDARDEIKKRIEQRDKYSIQLTIALGAILAAAFSGRVDDEVILVAPLVCIYFTVLIFYSYQIHRMQAQYLREKIEPELARLCGFSDDDIEWEKYYEKRKIPGIRHFFFFLMLLVISSCSVLYLWFSKSINLSRAVLIVVTSLYGLFMIIIIIWQYDELKKDLKYFKGIIKKEGEQE